MRLTSRELTGNASKRFETVCEDADHNSIPQYP
jgi:hypothetical protein